MWMRPQMPDICRHHKFSVVCLYFYFLLCSKLIYLLYFVCRNLILQSCSWQDLLGGHSLLLLNLKLMLPPPPPPPLHLDITHLRTSLRLIGARMRINQLFMVWYELLNLFFYLLIECHTTFHCIRSNGRYYLFFSMFTRIIFLFSILPIGQSGGAYSLTIYIVWFVHSWNKMSYNLAKWNQDMILGKIDMHLLDLHTPKLCYWMFGLVTEHTMNKQLYWWIFFILLNLFDVCNKQFKSPSTLRSKLSWLI